MATRHILTPAQQTQLFDPPDNEEAIARLYTLGSDDLAEIFRRRRPANRLGFATQLCLLRHPGRALRHQEHPPVAMLSMLAEQAACPASAFADYAARPPTLREHRAEAQAYLGLRSFERTDRTLVFAAALEVATSTDRGEPIVAAMVARLRALRIVLPASDTLERIALLARARARKAAYAGLTRELTLEQTAGLDALLTIDAAGARTGLAWLREIPEAPTAANLQAIVERLTAVRALGIEPERARRIHASRYGVMAREAAIMSAQHLGRLDRPRRLAILVAFAIEVEVALTDGAILLFEKMVGALFRRAANTRSERTLEDAKRLRETARRHAALGRLLIDCRYSNDDPRDAVEQAMGWSALEQSVREAEALTGSHDDGLDEVMERYPMVRRFAPVLLATFAFRASRATDPLLSALAAIGEMYAHGRRTLPETLPTSFLRPRWRRLVFPDGGALDRRAFEIAAVVHLRERIGSGSVWVEGSRAYRTLDDYLLPRAVFSAMVEDGETGLPVDHDFASWMAERRQLLAHRLVEVDGKAAAGTLPDAVIDGGELRISPLRNAVPEEAEALKASLYTLLPKVRITELLAEVTDWTGMAERFVHVRTGAPTSDVQALIGTVLADATNLGLARMADSSRDLTHSRLLWTAQWHIRDETYAAALAAVVDQHHALPHAAIWGPGTRSSSDGQFFRAGAKGEGRADRNARYGSDAGVLFYTHISDRYTPFHTKVIAANAGEAAHVIDGLLNHESQLEIDEYATDTAGAVDHVFGMCHLLGFRFAPRIRDLGERRLYTLARDIWLEALGSLVGGTVNSRLIEENWEDALRLAASIRRGTVGASVMLRKLAGYPRQNPVAGALREIGRIERSLFMLDWLDDAELRRRTNANLNKGEARNALARAVFFNRLGELRDRTFENQRHRAFGLNLVSASIILWNTVYLSRAVDHLRAQGAEISDELLSHVAPLGWEHISLTGDYSWGDLDIPEGGFRELRLPNRSFEA